MKTLRAGPLSLIFEEAYGSVRRLSVAGHEAVRRIYPAVRDKDWNTVPMRVWDVEVKESGDSFSVGYLARCVAGDIDFAWRASITGDPRGTLKFRMEGQARTEFLRNRIGFCVLHPARCAGLGAAVESADGGLRRGTFPRYIYPHPPFTNFVKIWYGPAPGLKIRVDLEGDTFEMEDQRNWTDASFKTYSTPSSVPRPIPTPKGMVFNQAVTVSLEESAPEPRPSPEPSLTLDAKPTRAFPRLGLSLAHHGFALRTAETDTLRALRPAHLRVDLLLAAAGWPDVLQRAADEAKAIGCALELALRFGPDGRCELLRPALLALKTPVARVLLFQDGLPAIQPARSGEAKAMLADVLPGVPVGGGSDSHFEQLNTGQPGKDWDLVCWPASPQVHQHDDLTIVENLEGLSAAVESARLFSGDRALCVTPVTLLPRTGPGAPGDMGSAPNVDSRQWSLVGAAWTVGSLKRLAESGVASVTFYETAGAFGVMDRDPKPVYPLYHVLADVLELAGARVIPCRSGDPLAYDGVAFALNGRTRILLANLGADPLQVSVSRLPARVLVKRLNDATVAEATERPVAWRATLGEEAATSMGRLTIELGPWEIVRIDA
jgi:D-apionolactonase